MLARIACRIDARGTVQSLDFEARIVGEAVEPGAAVEVEGVLDIAERVYRATVRDHGPGIPPEDLPFATERFYRGSNAHEAPGAGLGLFIARYLVGQMGGALRLEDADPGLRVALEFPLEP